MSTRSSRPHHGPSTPSARPSAKTPRLRRPPRMMEGRAQSDPPPLTEGELDFNEALEALARELPAEDEADAKPDEGDPALPDTDPRAKRDP